jgi:hypothetical protein
MQSTYLCLDAQQKTIKTNDQYELQTQMAELAAVVVPLRACIRDVLDSDFGWATGCPDCDFSVFFSPARVVPRQDHNRFLSSPFQFIIHHSKLYDLDTTGVVI